MSQVTDIQSVSEWNTTLRTATSTGQTVIVDAFATWCGPCKQIAPVFDQLAKSYPWVKFIRFDVDKLPAIAQKYKVSAMPTFFAIRAGKVVETLKGADPQGLNRIVSTRCGPNPPIVPLSPEAEEAKQAGNESFKTGDFATAITHYSKAIDLAPTSYLLYGNRSLSYLKQSPPNYNLAFLDAERSIELSPDWAKGYVRKGEALEGIGGRDEEVKECYRMAVEKGTGTVKQEATTKLEKLKAKLG